MIKAVFIDIDETLTNSQREITKETQDEIKRCVEKGIKIILASGRSRKEAMDFQEQIGTSPYIISSNGASCYDAIEAKEIYNESLKKEVVKELLEYSKRNKYKLKLNYKDKLVLNEASFPDEKDKVKTIEELEKIIEEEDIVQCVVADSDIEKMKKFKMFLEENFYDIKIVNESKRLKNPELKPSKSYYCDIASANVSKGRAILAVCKYLNLEKEEIVTIGDGENDVSMFETTPNSVAMENALESIKKQAKYLTATNDENGVAEVLKKL